jgi:cysteine-rich repeat protein
MFRNNTEIARVCSLLFGIALITLSFAYSTDGVSADSSDGVATTTVSLSICGDTLVSPDEQCDVPGETGGYSTTILGRQCSATCQYGPYCGDGVLQTTQSETCDDGNNASGDFCSDVCLIEPQGGGGGNSSGSSGGGGGGSSVDLGDTSVSINGRAFPNQTVHVVKDASEIGTVRATSDGVFKFSTASEPGTATFGFWSIDANGTRSTTFNTTFDVSQGAITTISGVYIPPTIALDKTSVPRGEPITFKGQTVPNATVRIYIDASTVLEQATAGSDGKWTFSFDTSKISQASHTVKVKFELPEGSGTTKKESTFSNILSFGVGVGATPIAGSADLNRDGKVNLIDFSILVFWWGTTGGASNPPADINSNAKVGLEDFSILLFNWTG